MGMSYKGAISFGLIYIPVVLHNVVRNNNIRFNLIDKETMSRIQYKKTCVDCNNKEVLPENIVKGYEYQDEKYVIFTSEDFEKIKSKKDKNITINQFISLNGIDPLYYDKAYYVVPEKGAERAFALLKAAMEKEKKSGIAKTVLGTKETLISLRVKSGIMYLNTLHFHEELQNYPYQETKMKLDKQELNLAITLLNTLTKPFDISGYHDEYRKKVEEAITAKIAGNEVFAKDEDELNPGLDLMTALQASLKNIENDARA